MLIDLNYPNIKKHILVKNKEKKHTKSHDSLRMKHFILFIDFNNQFIFLKDNK